jgi:hypothetical protein
MFMSSIRGVNIHSKPWGTPDPYVWNNAPAVINAVATLGFNAIRMDAGGSMVNTTERPNPIERLKTVIALCKDRDIYTQVVITLPFNGNRTDKGTFPDTAQGRYDQGYTLVKNIIEAVPTIIPEIEIENEVTQKVGMLWKNGKTLAEYNTTALNEWAELMKGEYDAIRKYSPTTKIIVGSLNNNYKYIPWLKTKGIDPDIIGYHLYFEPGSNSNLSDWQFGGSWHDEMLRYGKPITINEINGHPNSGATSVWGKDGLEQLRESPVPIHSIYVYELLDSAVEPGFGLCTLNTNRIQKVNNVDTLLKVLPKK